MDQLLTIEQVAAYLSVSPRTVRRLLLRGLRRCAVGRSPKSPASIRTRCGVHSRAAGWSRGGSLAALQQVFGHASIVTAQRYARLTDEIVMAEKLKMSERATRRTTSVS